MPLLFAICLLSDFCIFQWTFLGTFAFVGPGYPVYHSLYDDYVWMAKFGDPGFRRHVAGLLNDTVFVQNISWGVICATTTW